MSAPGRARRRRELSQHFLRKGALASRLIETSNVSTSDLVLEVGAGRGALTRRLAGCARRVIAIEIDPRLCRDLRGQLGAESSVEVVEGDFLSLPLPRVPYKVVGNLPFSRTSEILRRLDSADPAPDDAWLIVQREVARRYAAGPWGPESALSLKLKVRWQIEVASWLRPRDFDPPPSVEAAWLWLARRPRPLIDESQRRRYEDFVDTTFRHGSSIKTAMRTFATHTQLERLARDLRFQLRARPSDLNFDQWLALFRFVQ